MIGYAVVVVLASLILSATEIPPQLVVFIIVCLAFLVYMGYPRRFLLILKTLKRDVSALMITNTRNKRVEKYRKEKKLLRDLLYKQVRRHGNKEAFVDADDATKTLTFTQVQDLAHKIANIFRDRGYKKGDVVALFMENRVEYMAIWLGLSMIGVITSLINYNIRGESLKHCMTVAKCKGIIFSESLVQAVKEVEPEVGAQFFCFDDGLATVMESTSAEPPPRPPEVLATDTLLYMYTSGTTGLPKAVIWSAFKNASTAIGYPLVFGLKESDTVYIALPLYHANSMLIANIIFFNGGTVVVKKKFSASRYIDDCSRHGVTVINYVGEICRYLLSQPPKETDKTNKIRLAMGNGLRASIWNEFKERFQIDKIIEFYASTEGNARPFPNVVGRVGAVGFNTLLFPNKDFKLIQMDEATGKILRDAQGLALEAEEGQPGQVVGRISVTNRFDGYTNREADESKIGYNIFEHGDSAFLSGDILVRDAEGYYYFRDRTGDTFRWKSENVSTNEVEGLISKIVKLSDVCVYGVSVAENEGKAGMACILDPGTSWILDVDHLPEQLDKVLPKYAQPQFIRITKKGMDQTSTFKFQKNKLRQEGYNPVACDSDALYYFNKKEGKYSKIGEQEYDAIRAGKIAF